MGQFSNATEGLMYQEEYCFHCWYWNTEPDPGPGCPIWFLHELYMSDRRWRVALDQMIPVPKPAVNGECEAFWDKRESPVI